MANVAIELQTGYSSYFSFATGFEPTSNLVSTLLIDNGFMGYIYRAIYADGSRIDFGLNEGGTTDLQPPTFDNLIFYSFGTLSGGLRVLDNLAVGNPGNVASIEIYGPGNNLLLGSSGFNDWVGSVFAEDFLTKWLSGNDTLRPSDNPSITVTSNQTLIGYGGSDIIYGGSGNDVIIPGLGDNRVVGGDTGVSNPATVTGNDTFIIGEGVAVGLYIQGTAFDFNPAMQPGEVNTIRATGNNDFSLSEVLHINRIEFAGASLLLFGAGNFGGDFRISHDAVIVGDAGANAIRVYLDTTAISPGHTNAGAASSVDLSAVTFAGWANGQDSITVVGNLTQSNTIVGSSVGAGLTGGQGSDTITGGAGNDRIVGLGGADTLAGGGGNDEIAGGGDNDVISGGDGNDTAVFAGNRADYSISGSIAALTIADTVGGRDGTDSLSTVEFVQFADGVFSVDALLGGGQPSLFDDNSNYVVLTVSGSSWSALAGSDTVIGTAGDDVVDGGVGYDNLYGGGGADVLYGGADEDIIVGDAGNDWLYGGNGGDVLSELYDPVGSGDDVFDGGNGIDIMYSAGGNDIVYGGTDASNNYANLGDGNDTYVGAAGTDVVQGGAGSDTIIGIDGDDSLYGEGGDDFVYGGAGIDLLSGADGNDWLDGGAGNDLLVGDGGNDTLLGGGGIDVLYGFAGDDILNGGTGGDVDALYGGAGNDSFQVGGTGYGIDYIWDFQGGTGASDRILLANGALITSKSASSGNYYINLSNGSQVVVVGVTSVLAEDIVINGF